MIIDFHTHVFPSCFSDDRSAFFSNEPAFENLYFSPQAKLVGVEELIRHMDEEEIQKSVIFGFPWENPENYRRHNDYIIESVHQHPKRLIGFCCFSPLATDGSREADRCLQSGLSGVGELAAYGTGLSSEMIHALQEVMALCSQFDVPLLLHTNEPVGHNYAGKTPMTLHQIYHFLKMTFRVQVFEDIVIIFQFFRFRFYQFLYGLVCFFFFVQLFKNLKKDLLNVMIFRVAFQIGL